MSNYETVIGLEVHAQLLTESKMFCGCSTKFGARPNTNICPVCTGQPGVLPVLNKKAVELAIKTALALNCRIERHSIFARKNYFYPDLPKDYQVSQFELPLATNGYLDIVVQGQKRRIGITRVHLEEDAGKLVHQGAGRIMGSESSLVDYNRTGTPLMEIVSEPDIRSAEEGRIYMEELQKLLKSLLVCDAKMEEGSLRCDANLSIRPVGQAKFGTKTEVKNMNSFKAVEKALLSEEKRHREVLGEGGSIIQETRFFDDVTETTTGMRSKEQSHDYRYFPEPDLVPVEPDNKWVEEIKSSIGELPQDRKKRFIEYYKIPADKADILIANKKKADVFEEISKHNLNWSNLAANTLTGVVSAYENENNTYFDDLPLTSGALSTIFSQMDRGVVSGTMVKNVIIETLRTGKEPMDIIKEQGLTQISDEGALVKIVEDVIKNNPKQVEQFKSGKDTVIMFLVGQVMKASQGRAKPDKVQELIRKLVL